MSRENLSDFLPRGKRRDQEEPRQFYRSTRCELRGCACNGHGKPDIAIQDANKHPIGYVCQKGYHNHITSRGLDQFSQWKPTGTQIKPHQTTLADTQGLQSIAVLVSELDRYADSIHDRDDDHANPVD